MYLIEFYGLSFIAETIEDLYSYRDCVEDEGVKNIVGRHLQGHTKELFCDGSSVIKELPSDLGCASIQGGEQTYKYTNMWDQKSLIYFSDFKADFIYGKHDDKYFRAGKYQFNNLIYIIPDKMREGLIDPNIKYGSLASDVIKPSISTGFVRIYENNGENYTYTMDEIKNKVGNVIYFIDTYFKDRKQMMKDCSNPAPANLFSFFAELLED